MGVDCRVTLPGDARLDDVAKVIGLLLGGERRWETSGNAKWVAVDGVQIRATNVLEMAWIAVSPCHLLPRGLTVNYHFEWTGGERGDRLADARSTAVWIALARRLVNFFGGSVDYNDCQGEGADYTVARHAERQDPGDGVAWDAFQDRLWGIVPLSAAEVKLCQKWAAYK